MIDPTTAGLLAAALIIAAALACGLRRGRVPRELAAAALAAAALAAALGIAADMHWCVAGELYGTAALPAQRLWRAAALLTSPAFLESAGLAPESAPRLRAGLAVKTSGGEVRLTYRWQGFGRAPHGALLCEAFVAHATREREAVLFAAALLDARATEDLEAALHTASPHLSRTARLLVRGILPELRDRFPAAAALLATLGRRAGERIPLTPRAVEDP